MKKKILLAIAFTLGLWVLVLARPSAGNNAPTPTKPETSIAALFSPGGGCTDAIVTEIKAAKKTLDIEIYAFTSQPIAQAVIDAAARGVEVRVLIDKRQRQEKASAGGTLAEHHIATFVDDQHGVCDKVVLIDGTTLITGSFNFTRASEERNDENLLIVRDRPKLVAAYTADFEHHLSHSSPFNPSLSPAKP